MVPIGRQWTVSVLTDAVPSVRSIVPQGEKRRSQCATVTRCFLALAAFVLVLPVFSFAQTASDMEILRQKLKADKKLIVASAMQLTEAEAKGFWPVYDAFQADLDKINGQIGQVIKTYAEVYRADTLTNDKAQELLGEVLKAEQAELDLKRAYVPQSLERSCLRSRSSATSRWRTRSGRFSKMSWPTESRWPSRAARAAIGGARS